MAEQRNSSGLEGRFATLHEFVKAAKLKLTAERWDYMVGAAETETTLKRNRYAIDSVAFRPRVLRDVSGVACTGPVHCTPLISRSTRGRKATESIA